MIPAFFRSRRAPAVRARGPIRRRQGLGGWEALGGSQSGLAEIESLESRIALAADLGTEFVEPSAYYVPGSSARYVVTVMNLGNEAATNVAFSTNLASQFTSRTWTAVYSGGANGPRSGAGNISTGNTIDLPIGGAARFTIDGIFAASATGNAVSSATATVAGEVDTLSDNTATNTREQAAQAITVSDDASRTSGATVRMVDPAAGTEINRFTAYDGTVRGVQTVMADMDDDGRPEIVTVPLRGGQGEIRVFTAEGVELPQYRLQPFGPSWAGGLSIAVGDFDGDGLKDIAAAKATGDGEVRVFRGQAGGDPIADAPYRTIRPFGAAFLGGANIAAADMGTFSGGAIGDAGKQDGRDELIVGGGPTAAAVVRIYDMSGPVPAVVDEIRPFASNFRGGVSVAPARINLDGIPDLIVAAGRRGNARVEIYDGRAGAGANPRLDAFTATSGGLPAAFATAIDTDGDGRADTIYASQGVGSRGSLTEFDRDGTLIGSLGEFAGPTRVAAPFSVTDPALVTTSTGLMYRDLVVGTGSRPSSSSATVTVRYEGRRLADGSVFDASSRHETSPGAGTSFPLNRVIRGWTEGLSSMAVGGRRQLIIPENLAYPGGVDGPAGTLVFDVELLSTT